MGLADDITSNYLGFMVDGVSFALWFIWKIDIKIYFLNSNIGLNNKKFNTNIEFDR